MHKPLSLICPGCKDHRNRICRKSTNSLFAADRHLLSHWWQPQLKKSISRVQNPYFGWGIQMAVVGVSQKLATILLSQQFFSRFHGVFRMFNMRKINTYYYVHENPSGQVMLVFSTSIKTLSLSALYATEEIVSKAVWSTMSLSLKYKLPLLSKTSPVNSLSTSINITTAK